MDISNIDVQYIEVLGSSYAVLKDILKNDPRKVRKIVSRMIADEDFPPEVMNFIGDNVSDEEFIAFLKTCDGYVELHVARQKQAFDRATEGMAQEVKYALEIFIQEGRYTDEIDRAGDDRCFVITDTDAYLQTLILKNVSGIPENADRLSFDEGTLCKRDGVYVLNGQAEFYQPDEIKPFEIKFDSAEVESAVYRADVRGYDGTPWEQLEAVAGMIVYKHSISDSLLNEREKELLPLAVEIYKLSDLSVTPEEFDGADFSQFKSRIQKHGFDELLPLVENFENGYHNLDLRSRFRVRLNGMLNLQKYEPLWRELYGAFSESQAGYPVKAEALCDPEILGETRSMIQRIMEKHGYTGSYPDYVKKGWVRGLHLLESYNVSYTVGAEKNVVHRIHCTELYECGCFSVEFLCGAEFLKKNETAGDIYSCLFNAKGRRLAQAVCYERLLDEDAESEHADLEMMAEIAVKKAELKKLTKEEFRQTPAYYRPYGKIFAAVFVFAGGMFGVLMTLAMMLITKIIDMMAGEPIPTSFAVWLVMCLGCWVLFGSVMGAVTVLSKRK